MTAATDAVKDATAPAKATDEVPTETKQRLLQRPAIKTALPFINGGIAGMFFQSNIAAKPLTCSGMTATTCIQPVDMIKVRLQLAGEGVKTGPRATPLSVAREVLAGGKILDLYTGLSAGLLRQVTYTTARLGFFDTFMKGLTKNAEARGNVIGFKERAGAGLLAGGLAAMVGNPADLALIRMQSDGLKPVAARANYKSVIDALTRVAKTEGITAWWSGATPTVVRAMALNFGQLAFFSEAKTRLKHTDLGPRTQTLTASAIAGFFASFFSLPFDFVKTRLQRQTRSADGTLPYKGMVDTFRKVAKEEGLLRFYRGFTTYCALHSPSHSRDALLMFCRRADCTPCDDHTNCG